MTANFSVNEGKVTSQVLEPSLGPQGGAVGHSVRFPGPAGPYPSGQTVKVGSFSDF
jgi:hypothetical protein